MIANVKKVPCQLSDQHFPNGTNGQRLPNAILPQVAIGDIGHHKAKKSIASLT